MNRKHAALAILASAQLLLILDTAVTNVAVPSIAHEFRVTTAGVSWVANAYLVTFGGLLLLGGRLADLAGPRLIFMTGLGLLAAASLAGSLAGGVGPLVAARAVQGCGAALAGAAAFALMLTLFAEGPERNRALGVLAAMGGLGGAVGTVLGGVLTSWLGWRSTFALNVAAASALLVLAPYVLPRAREVRPQRGFDLLGAVTATGGLGLLAYALVSTGETGWTAPRTLTAAALAVLLLAAFALVESRVARPLVPFAVLARPGLRLANTLGAFVQITLYPMFFLVSLYMQAVLGYSPVVGGLGFLPLCVIVIIVAARTDRLIGSLGLRTVLVSGFSLVAVSLAWQSRLTVAGSFAANVLGPSLLLGVALPLVTITANVAATAGTAPEEAGLASGLINTSQQFGAVLGLAVLSSVATAQQHGRMTPAAMTTGFSAALLAGADLAVVAALLGLAVRSPAPAGAAHPAADSITTRRGEG